MPRGALIAPLTLASMLAVGVERPLGTGAAAPERSVVLVHGAFADGSVEELWETSTDAGRSWQVRSHGVLRRFGG